MPFGVKLTQKVFQKHMSQHFGDLPGVEADIDDILVWGSSPEEHSKRLRVVVDRCKTFNLNATQEQMFVWSE
ncbi:hypothetical protein HOLleu_07233 [Holothuria leucospilota]|uniref:Reverse transcriptase n=1 Tax=Holothuria leucospilota TaxID=206669 RepID=A0A9Q1HCN0_HOLLE|nr:hypothetical protein HOLleu_07233 [Holothuria leucospilota]